MATNFPALSIQQPNIAGQLAQAQQIVGMRQEQQLRNLQIQAATRAQNDLDATTRAMANLKPDANGRVDYDSLPDLIRQAGGSGEAQMAATNKVFEMKAKASQIAKDDAATALSNVDAHIKINDQYRGRILNISDNMTDPAQKQTAWANEYAAEKAAGMPIPPGITDQYPGDTVARSIANNFAVGSTLVKEAQDRQKLAQEAWKPVSGMLYNTVTGEKIGGIQNWQAMNDLIDLRYKQVSPGATKAPDQFHLTMDSTPADLQRVDTMLAGLEKDKETSATLGLREQMFQLNTSKEGYNWVTGTATQGPSAGKIVAVPVSQIAQYGIQDAGKMESTDITKTQSGRQWLVLANKRAPADAPPDQMGIGQLIDKLDKEGKLGPLAGRFQEWAAGTWGQGDADYAALRTKLDLSNTLLATVHSGRLGPFLMENMQGLANSGKMTGATLRSAFRSEIDYVSDRAMDPSPPNYNFSGKGAGAAATQTKTSSTPPPGATHTVFNRTDGKMHWTDANNSKDMGVANQ